MTTPADGEGQGSALVAELAVVARSMGVVGTVEMVDGELVVRVGPSRVREATTRPLPREPAPTPTTLAGVGCMRYVGPLTTNEALRWRVEVARWAARPWWRRWATDLADGCWRWRS